MSQQKNKLNDALEYQFKEGNTISTTLCCVTLGDGHSNLAAQRFYVALVVFCGCGFLKCISSKDCGVMGGDNFKTCNTAVSPPWAQMNAVSGYIPSVLQARSFPSFAFFACVLVRPTEAT